MYVSRFSCSGLVAKGVKVSDFSAGLGRGVNPGRIYTRRKEKNLGLTKGQFFLSFQMRTITALRNPYTMRKENGNAVHGVINKLILLGEGIEPLNPTIILLYVNSR